MSRWNFLKCNGNIGSSWDPWLFIQQTFSEDILCVIDFLSFILLFPKEFIFPVEDWFELENWHLGFLLTVTIKLFSSKTQ
jgi:hypothetical protein